MLPRRRMLHVLSAAPLVACSSETAAPAGDGGRDAIDGSGEADADAAREDDGADASICPGVYHGSVEDFPGSTWRLSGVGDDRVILARDDSGLYAYSATCTHEKCFVELTDAFGSARCPCHGATFDGDGLVTAGPATVSLAHYAVVVCGRRVYVDRSRIVPAYTRTVP